jgi:hypothetical protein
VNNTTSNAAGEYEVTKPALLLLLYRLLFSYFFACRIAQDTSEQDLLLMFLLPHVKARHMSIIHALVYFSKLENREKKIIKKKRTDRKSELKRKSVCREKER